MSQGRFSRLLTSLLLFLAASLALSAAERVVTIESAQSTEYIKTSDGAAPEVTMVAADSSDAAEIAGVEASPNADGAAAPTPEAPTSAAPTPAAPTPAAPGEIIRFRGAVVISVTEGSSKSRIAADEITYDKGRDTLEARGAVVYEHSTGAGSTEKFTGEALLFNIKKQEGVFLDGVLTQDTGKVDSDPYVIHAEITGRDSGSTMAFSNAMLTTCDAEDPHWSINASRIWLLPGNEIAILNGVFFIGPLPVFYIPAFYYPSDEMIIHPVFGFRNREGYFTQTTTYLIGRKPLAKKDGNGSSFADFLQGDTLKEQERNGLFLTNTEVAAKSTDPDYLKLMVDAYSSLGGMAGLDGSFTQSGYVKSVAFSAALAVSRTLHLPSGGVFYSPYSGGTDSWDDGWFFGNRLPFRYRSTFSLSMDKSPFQMTVSVPLISDPTFKSDFLDRSEDLNWFTLLTDQASLAEGSSISSETSYSWSVSGSIRPDVSFADPLLKTFSFSTVSGLLTFNSTTNAEKSVNSPEYRFFYPEIIKPTVKMSLGGTILSSSGSSPSARKEAPATGSLNDPFRAAAPTAALPDASSSDAAPASAPTDASSPDAATTAALPDAAVAGRFFAPSGTSLIPSIAPPVAAWSLTWAMEPSWVQEIRYDTASWNSPDDINWNNFASSYYQLRTTGNITGSYSWDSTFFTASSALNFTGTYQDHPYLRGVSYDTETERNTVYLTDYKANVYALSSTESVKLAPFNRNALLKPFSLAWNFTGDVVRTVFEGTADEPRWETETMDWSKDYIDTHNATVIAGVALGGYEQKLTVTSNLPPLLQAYSGNVGLGWSFISASVSTKLYEKENADKTWYWDPFKATLSWKLPFGISLGQEYIYSIEDDEPSRFSLTGSYGYLTGYYTLNNTIPYRLEEGSGWVLAEDGKTKFIPTAAGLTLGNASKPLKLYSWKNRIFLQTSFTSNLSFNLLKLTDSSFTFAPSIAVKVHEFLDLTFTSTSSNEVIARYFQDWMDLPEPLSGETNPVTDLIKSFNFLNRRDREETGFKLKSLSMSMNHYLHDWTMSLTATASPELNEDTYEYEFVPTVTFIVSWKPISDIKTTVKSAAGVFSLNTTDDDEED